MLNRWSTSKQLMLQKPSLWLMACPSKRRFQYTISFFILPLLYSAVYLGCKQVFYMLSLSWTAKNVRLLLMRWWSSTKYVTDFYFSTTTATMTTTRKTCNAGTCHSRAFSGLSAFSRRRKGKKKDLSFVVIVLVIFSQKHFSTSCVDWWSRMRTSRQLIAGLFMTNDRRWTAAFLIVPSLFQFWSMMGLSMGGVVTARAGNVVT